ncbi:hypothetical protein yc1106_02462 [Curvularia clavata]|uniref:Uncharacterized protein n=1 Tax=Curvularia clavata TaxID=95742 RepID=A0A9Q9DPH9_CURCL|nr:hypothetical protein yc1106_02462 [Curvularia clavata]
MHDVPLYIALSTLHHTIVIDVGTMVALPNSKPNLLSTRFSSNKRENILETETSLPGIKRGIAIGVACSVSIVLIALLAFLAIRRRNRILARRLQPQTQEADHASAQPVLQEKAWWPNAPSPAPVVATVPPQQPPVEADAHIIYELDAGQTPELHGDTSPQEVDGSGRSQDPPEEVEEMYVQKLKQWKDWNAVSETDPARPNAEVTRWSLPLLMVSPPLTARGDVSPLLRSSWDMSSLGTSPISPPANAHFPHGNTP